MFISTGNTTEDEGKVETLVFDFADVVQRIERMPSKHGVAGSNPAIGSKIAR